MADKMEFPKTMREFIVNYSFKDSAEVYTNGAELVPVFRVEQALEHYEKEIRNKALDEFVEQIDKHIFEEKTEEQYSNSVSFMLEIWKIAEQLKGVQK